MYAAHVWKDERFAYDEIRLCGLVPLGEQIFHVAFTEHDDCYRVISLRRATNREKKDYVSRHICQEDKRSMHFNLTQKGKDQLEKLNCQQIQLPECLQKLSLF